MAIWLIFELIWIVYFYWQLLPQLTNFRPEDSGKPLAQCSVDHLIDNVVFLINRDRYDFWSRVSGGSCNKDGSVPSATARCFLKSLLFLFDDCQHYKRADQVTIFERALSRIEDASGGFIPDMDAESDGYESEADEFDEIACAPVSGRAAKALGAAYAPKQVGMAGGTRIPNHIRSWIDDEHLGSLVSCTPLIMILLSYFSRMATVATVACCGFRRAHKDPVSGLECWAWRPTRCRAGARPLVLVPGAGFGLTSFLPLALHYQQRHKDRTILVYRLPWVEVCRPWVTLPQWSQVISGMVDSFAAVGLPQGCEVDVVGHSYGTAVSNRLLRALCETGASVRDSTVHTPSRRVTRSSAAAASCSAVSVGTGVKSAAEKLPAVRVHYLALLDPIVLGGATTGISGFTINQVGPDISFAFCGNRAGHGSKEVLDYDPRCSGHCLGGIGVYMSAGDLLVDVHLARHILEKHVAPRPPSCDHSTEERAHVQFCVDNTHNSFHGRWLVEMWCMGLHWGAPCVHRCLGMLERKLTVPCPSGEKPIYLHEHMHQSYDLVEDPVHVA